MIRDIKTGKTIQETVLVDANLVDQFASFSGDFNPLHTDSHVAREYGYAKPIAHGAILVAVLSRLIGMKLPGPGAIWLEQNIIWKSPSFVGDTIDFQLTVNSFSLATKVLELSVLAVNQKGETVMEGSGKVKVSETVGAVAPSSESEKVVLVTGGARGIGARIVQQLAAEKWIVAINYRSSVSESSKLVSDIEQEGGMAKAFQCDVSDQSRVKNMVEEILATFGHIDAVVHCATPALVNKNIEDLNYSDMEPYLKTYLEGSLALISATVPGMKQRNFGRFIFLGTSTLFGSPSPGWAAYITAKAALTGLMDCAALELGPHGITTNMISPSLTITDLTSDMPLRAKEVEARRNPMRRLVTPTDTAATVSFLLSDAAGFINGINLPLTGGPV